MTLDLFFSISTSCVPLLLHLVPGVAAVLAVGRLVIVAIVLEFAKEALAELNDTAVSNIKDTLGAPREGNKT